MKKWLIKKLGGMTRNEYYTAINEIKIDQVFYHIDIRVRGNVNQPFMVISNKPFEEVVEELDKMFIGEVNNIKRYKQHVNIGEQKFIVADKHRVTNQEMRSVNLKGYFYL